MESNHAPPPATLLQQCAGLSYQPALELVGRQGVEPCTSFLSGKRSTAEPAAHIFLSTASRSGKRSPPATLCLAMRAGTDELSALKDYDTQIFNGRDRLHPELLILPLLLQVR